MKYPLAVGVAMGLIGILLEKYSVGAPWLSLLVMLTGCAGYGAGLLAPVNFERRA